MEWDNNFSMLRADSDVLVRDHADKPRAPAGRLHEEDMEIEWR